MRQRSRRSAAAIVSAIGVVGRPIRRDRSPLVPASSNYSLTDLGREAAEQIRALAMWTHERMDQVQQARVKYDVARA